jgi:HK97 family phage prohead protease
LVSAGLMEDNTVDEVRELPDNYRPATSDDVPEGRACGNCIFFNEERLDDEGRAWCERWEAFAEGGAYCNAWEPRADNEISDNPDEDSEDELRQVDLTPPAYMRASARRGLEWHREGLAGDGIVDRTIREARAMSEGNVTADKWVRLRAWIARHLVDMDAPQNTPGEDGYPGPGAVAMALWGGGGSRRSAERALEYADGVVGRIEAENEGRAKGEALSKLETRIVEVEAFEVREEADGMHLEGYAALFNSRSENLGGFTETIKPGAFRASLKARNDIKLLWNHDTGAVLGSTRAGTLTLSEDERGLRVSATLPNTSYGRDAKELVARGDVSAFSFGFSMPARGGDEWNSEGTERVLKSVRLHEVSLVAFPAYPETAGTATVRGLDKVAKRAEVDADALADALLKIENGEDISTDDRQLLEKVLSELAPEPEVVEPDKGLEMLALKKKKLQLLMGL